MARTHRYKRLEKNLVSRIVNFFAGVFSTAGHACLKAIKFFDGKITLMLVPHSQSKVISFQTNLFALVLSTVILVGVAFSFIYFNHKTAASVKEVSRLKSENRDTLASLDELRDENNNLLQTAKRFQNSLNSSLSLLGINQTTSSAKASGKNSDLSSLFDSKATGSGTLKETSDVKQLTSYLESAVQPVERIGKMLKNQGALFSDIPNVWPIKNGIGHISMEFGQNVHPITQQWYIHKGLDFSTWRSGDPIIATANGQVVTVGYDASFGNFVIIKHKYGIYTRYAHMNSVRVHKGDTVTQRQIIGTIGNTGISTGPHLHYEVHIGADVVDPAKYINVK